MDAAGLRCGSSMNHNSGSNGISSDLMIISAVGKSLKELNVNPNVKP